MLDFVLIIANLVVAPLLLVLHDAPAENLQQVDSRVHQKSLDFLRTLNPVSAPDPRPSDGSNASASADPYAPSPPPAQ